LKEGERLSLTLELSEISACEEGEGASLNSELSEIVP
jgi:hypothetical protein